jgi:hypothetical protein
LRFARDFPPTRQRATNALASVASAK